MQSYKMDHFTLTNCFTDKWATKSNKIKCLSQSSPIKKTFLVFECENCGAAIGARVSQISIVCKTCHHKNKVISDHKVLLETDNLLYLQAAIQQSKIRRTAFNNLKTYCKLILPSVV